MYYTGIPIVLVILFWRLWNRTAPLELLLSEVLAGFGYVAAVTDLQEKRVPNGLVLAMLLCWGGILAPHFFFQQEETLFQVFHGIVGFLLGGILFFIVYLVSRKGLGGGDVKFMAVAGLYLGGSGVLSAMLYGSILAAVTGGSLLLLKKLKRTDSIPLIPFLYLGILLTLCGK